MTLELFGSAVSGGIIVAVLTFIVNWRKENRSDFDAISKAFQRENEILREEIKELKSRLESANTRLFEMESDLTTLRAHLIVLESSHFDHPFPQWMKGVNGEMLIMNKAYEQMFLRPIGKFINDYIGKKDQDIWPQHLADEYKDNDDWVIRTGQVWQGYEVILDENKKEKKIRIIKFPRYNGRTIIGVSGQVIPDLKQ